MISLDFRPPGMGDVPTSCCAANVGGYHGDPRCRGDRRHLVAQRGVTAVASAAPAISGLRRLGLHSGRSLFTGTPGPRRVTCHGLPGDVLTHTTMPQTPLVLGLWRAHS